MSLIIIIIIIICQFSIPWSVSMSYVCRLSHSCTLLKPFDRFRCHLAGTLVGSSEHCVRWFLFQGNGRFGCEARTRTCNCKLQPYCQSYAATWRIQRKSGVYSDSPFAKLLVLPLFPLCSLCGSPIFGVEFTLSGNGKESILILHRDGGLDHHQNLTTT